MLHQLSIFAATFLTSLGVGLGTVLLLDHRQRARRMRLVRYSAEGEGVARAAVAAEMSRIDAALRQPPGREGAHGALHEAFRARLRMAGLAAVRTELALATILGGALLVFGLVLVLGVAPHLAGAVAPVVAWLGFAFTMDALRARRVTGLADALPDALDMFARGLRAGRPIQDSLQIVAQHSQGIARDEFGRCREEMRMGMGLSEALGGLADRIDLADVRFIAVATALQAETGGNLVETLENLAAMLRARRNLKRKAAALSAETRTSAVILAGLPFVVSGVLIFVNPSYLQPLISDPRGMVMAALAAGSVLAGIVTMRKMAKIDV